MPKDDRRPLARRGTSQRMPSGPGENGSLGIRCGLEPKLRSLRGCGGRRWHAPIQTVATWPKVARHNWLFVVLLTQTISIFFFVKQQFKVNDCSVPGGKILKPLRCKCFCQQPYLLLRQITAWFPRCSGLSCGDLRSSGHNVCGCGTPPDMALVGYWTV